MRLNCFQYYMALSALYTFNLVWNKQCSNFEIKHSSLPFFV